MKRDAKTVLRPFVEERGIDMDLKKKIIITAVLVVLVIAVGAAMYIGGMGKALDSENTQTVSVTIPSGSGTGQIGQLLEEEGVISSADKFKLWSRIKGYDSQYKAGIYAFSASMDFETIADILVGGKVNMVSFTVPEGLTLEQTIDKLVSQGMGSKENFQKEVKDKKWFDKYEFLRYSSYEDEMRKSLSDNYLEGYMMPNTYYVAEGAS